MNRKTIVAEKAVVLLTVRIIVIQKVNVRVKCHCWCVSEFNISVAMHGRMWECERVLTYSTSHWVSGQYTHRVTWSPLTVSIKVYQRYYLSQVNCGAPNHNTASIWASVIPLTFSGRVILSVFPRNAFADFKQAILSMIMFGAPVSENLEGNVHYCVDSYIFRHIDTGHGFIARVMIRLNSQLGCEGFYFPIVGPCPEATQVIYSLHA